MSSLPHFICIGAQKSASSWLYQILKTHPQVWMPPMKELHFFDIKGESSHFWKYLLKKEHWLGSQRRFKYSNKKLTNWNYKYFFTKRDQQHYASLFNPKEGQICGEITPSYCTLDTTAIRDIYEVMPNVKIIYLLRNPLERDWSQVCMRTKNTLKKSPEELTDKELIEGIIPKMIKQSNYTQNLQNWESVFDKEQFHLAFFDELQTDVASFLNGIFQFLGLKKINQDIFQGHLSQKVNSYSKTIPEKVLQAIAEREYNSIQNVHNKLNNQYTQKWLDQVNLILSNSKSIL